MGAKRHPDQVVFVARVLWLQGFTLGEVTARLSFWRKVHGSRPYRRGQVKGMLERSPDWYRSAFTKAERQARIDRMMEQREDGGFFTQTPEAEDLSGAQARAGA